MRRRVEFVVGPNTGQKGIQKNT